MAYKYKEKKTNGKNATGRPDKFDETTILKLEEIFKIDGTVKDACSYAGISYDTYFRWLKTNEQFSERMARAQQYPFIFAKNKLFSTMKSKNDAIAQRGAIEFLRRRDRRYKDKIDSTVDLEADVKTDVNFKDKSMIELEDIRKKLLGF